jgi:4'-phosphopantetheinyl transferase
MIEIQTWPLPPEKLSPPEVGQLHLWWIDTESGQKALLRLLSDDERSRAARFIDDRAQRCFVCARGALRSVLSRYLNHPPQSLLFEYGPMGKPALRFPDSDLGFNLSHSGNRALLAVTSGNPVGIDLEPLRSVPNVLPMAKKVFSKRIFRHLTSLPKERLSGEFLHQWTMLEAKVKAEGRGVFSKSPGQITALGFQPSEGWSAAVAMHPRIPGPETWTTYRFPAQTQ